MRDLLAHISLITTFVCLSFIKHFISCGEIKIFSANAFTTETYKEEQE